MTPDVPFEADSLTFLGEQDGEVERELKAGFTAELAASPSVRRAYLALVQYGPSPDANVALCLFASTEDITIVQACSARFHQIFNPNEHLDILFLNADQDRALAQVCTPFFCR